MLAIELIRTDPDLVRRAVDSRGDTVDIDRILELDERRRAVAREADDLRAVRNEVSKEIGKTKDKPPELIQQMRDVGTKIKGLEEETRTVATELDALMLTVPNIPDDDVPLGADDSDNVLLRTVGDQPSFDFTPLPHYELGERLDIIDFQRGVKLSGSRFYVLKGKGARLQRALISWMLDLHTEEHGYREMYLPDLVTRETATGSGQLPKFSDTMYHDDESDLWLIPTAEVPITGLHAGEILNPGELPFHYVAHTPCFRREKAAAGKDTRGIKRLHQFEKVEMFKFVEASESKDALESMVADAEAVCAGLGLAYQVLLLCTGDLSVASTRTYDLNVWAPGVAEWLEVSSCSNCTDYQSRRSSVRHRPEVGARPEFPHTLNGSGLGIPRTMIAIMEHYQQADGTIVVPEVLRPYTRFDVIGAAQA